jgi:hypothetical protein
MCSSFCDLSQRYFSHSDFFQSSFSVKVFTRGYVQSGSFPGIFFRQVPCQIFSQCVFQSEIFFHYLFQSEFFTGKILSGIISKRFSCQVFFRSFFTVRDFVKRSFSVREFVHITSSVRVLCKRFFIHDISFSARIMFILEPFQT